MSDTVKLNIDISSILNVPLNTYEDFTFIVNDESYKTTTIIADLLSNKISQLHLSDPTFSTFTINTKSNGDFSQILELADFKNKKIAKKEIPFFSEVLEQLDCKCFNFTDSKYEILSKEIIFDTKDEEEEDEEDKSSFLYSKYNDQILYFISSHFYEIYQTYQEELINLPEADIRKILEYKNLRVESEDQLLDFINQLYYNDRDLSYLYEYVQFKNVSVDNIKEFLELFKFYDMTTAAWISISKRLLLDPSIEYKIPETN